MDPELFNFSNEINLTKQELVEIYQDSDGQFEALNRLASVICKTPVSLVNFLDDNFQYTVSKFGKWSNDSISPKQHTACQFTVTQDDPLIINDTLNDDKVRNIKELVEDDSIRFYAGMSIKSPGGTKLGAICVIDYEPRELNEEQTQSLKDLAQEVEYRLKLYRQKKKAEFSNRKLAKAAAFLNNSTDLLLTVDQDSLKILGSKGADTIFESNDEKMIGQNLISIIDEIHLKKHLKEWMDKGTIGKKFGIPAKIKVNGDLEKWFYFTFSNYENYLLVTGRDIQAQYKAEQNLKKSLNEKEVLLSEIHHRVKNNLAMVNGMLMLERLNTADEKTSSILHNSETRIITISKIHELLYETHDFTKVNLDEYVTDLVEYLKDTFTVDEANIQFVTQISDIALNVNQALPMGLIINELLTNSIKHAFNKQDKGIIQVIIHELKNNFIHFEVSDNGVGMEIDPAELKKQGSLGFSLISTLKQQLKADLEIDTESGTKFAFKFEKHYHKGAISNTSVMS